MCKGGTWPGTPCMRPIVTWAFRSFMRRCRLFRWYFCVILLFGMRGSTLFGIWCICGPLSRDLPTPTPAFLIPLSFWMSRATTASDSVGRGVLNHEVAPVQAMISRVDECFGSIFDTREIDKGKPGFCHTRRIHAQKKAKSFMSVSVCTRRTDTR